MRRLPEGFSEKYLVCSLTVYIFQLLSLLLSDKLNIILKDSYESKFVYVDEGPRMLKNMEVVSEVKNIESNRVILKDFMAESIRINEKRRA